MVLIRKPDGNRPLGRCNYRYECNIKILVDLKEIGWKGVDWIHLAEDRDQWHALVDVVMYL
jgi:hypothetical protein